MSEKAVSKKWWQGLTGYHWFVFAMAASAWVFDCLDQQIFILARGNALESLLPKSMSIADQDLTVLVKTFGGYATSIFMIGWATGGLIFGPLGDRYGRAKMLTVTVLLYSVCTGLSAFSQGWIDFAIFRFITGLGVGGVFGLAVALVADTLPERSRTPALGLLQALSALGNIAAGATSMVVGGMVTSGSIQKDWGWKVMFLVGAIPAFLCVLIAMRLKEPEKWVAAREAGKLSGVKLGSYSSLFRDPTLSRNALAGMMLCVAGVVGVWGIGFFAPDLVRDVIGQSLSAKGMSDQEIKGAQAYWIGINSIIQNTGAFFGMLSFTWVAQQLGRKPAFVLGIFAAAIATVLYFQFFSGTSTIWMSFFMGFFQLALFAGFAIYLPELFPLRLRSTGISFCYNVGRYIAATGPFTIGALQAYLAKSASTSTERIDAFRDAGSYMTIAFAIGLVALYFLPETKGRPLPE
ncbi:MAG: MFS transporter [Pirellulaceae bacterium]|nr:MFS transporter [Pirellulaceae bacterium]